MLTEALFDGVGRVRRTRTENPGSTGGYTGQLTEYNILGQVKRQSVPTEINSSWNPAGDDYRGMSGSNYIWLWNSQEYDWKGRTTRTIPSDSTGSDGKDTLITYAGCGCAGGLVTTVKGPVTAAVDVSGSTQTTKRRTQKSYEDILGRTYKMEVWDLDGGGSAPYSTTKTTFNGRDQATMVRQYSGSDSSSTYQDTTMSYDGHGRLASSHKPEQKDSSNNPTYTTYSYNTDDTVATVTDSRGAAVSYTYNSRRLVEQASYSVPSGSSIPVTPTASFTYDNAGNRTQMTDGLGTVVYEYDELSRMKSEERDLTDDLPNAPATGKYKLEYTYTLSGGLKSLKDPFDDQVDYGYDRTGRLLSVTSPTPYGGISSYASDAHYRAWGALKDLSYGNNTQMSQTFNSRLQVATYQLNSLGSPAMSKNYSYYADNKLSYSQDVLNSKFDRLNTYDFEGRIRDAKSSYDARGQQVPDLADLPYRESYGFNAFGNLAQRNNLHWGYTNDISYTYQNNRITNQGWLYDNDGRNVKSGDQDVTSAFYTYDAAGKMVKTENWQGILTSMAEIDSGLDGEGREVKHVQRYWSVLESGEIDPNTPPDTYTNYYIRSSVLGGEVVSLIRYEGAKEYTNIYAGGAQLARQEYGVFQNQIVRNVRWDYLDASGSSGRDGNGTEGVTNPLYGTAVEMDASGIIWAIQPPIPNLRHPAAAHQKCSWIFRTPRII